MVTGDQKLLSALNRRVQRGGELGGGVTKVKELISPNWELPNSHGGVNKAQHRE